MLNVICVDGLGSLMCFPSALRSLGRVRVKAFLFVILWSHVELTLLTVNHINPGVNVGLPALSVGKGTMFPLNVDDSQDMLVVRLVLLQVFFRSIVL